MNALTRRAIERTQAPEVHEDTFPEDLATLVFVIVAMLAIFAPWL